MPQCQVVTLAGTQCRNAARANDTVCSIHRFHEDAPRCHRCHRRAVINDLCQQHYHIDNMNLLRELAYDLWDELYYMGTHGADIRELEERLQDAYERGDINRVWYTRLGLRLLMLEVGLEMEEEDQQEEAQPDNLQAFADDPQSVHRAPVSEQTNRGMAILLAAVVPPEQKTLDEITTEWGSSRDAKKLIADMRHWYKQAMCREAGDWLYKKALDGLWVLIKASEFRSELVKRLREEAEDAYAKCCDGHLTRLVNVMVGFHDGFNPPVSQSELIQQRMSAIAGQDLSIEEKALEAWKVLDELAVPESARSAWIDAF